MEQFKSLREEEVVPAPITLMTNALLDNCARALAEEPYGIDQAKELLSHLNLDPEKDHDDNTIFDVLARMHIVNIVTKFAEDHDSVTLNPIRYTFALKKYGFRIHTNNYNTISSYTKSDHIQITDYDELMIVDELPVAIDIKKTPKPNILDTTFNPDRITRKLAPLQEYFAFDRFGYIVVTSPEAIRENSARQKMFKQRGGILLSFPTSLEPIKEYLKTSPVLNASSR